ncbi:MAG: DUF2207 domain-containing protein [Candidatus Woykebacteria bacterium]
MKYLPFLTAFLFLLSAPAFAQENWLIESFSSQIEIQTSGKVKVVENIAVDFGSLQKHGIFRDVPFVYLLENGEKRYSEIEVVEISNNGQSTPYETYTTGDFIEIKTGDPDETISGKQNYQIEYLASGVLNSFEDHDELYWNVTGNNWPVPINQTSATVTLPSDAISQITCFEGSAGSNTLCQSRQVSKSQENFQASRPLGVQEGLTVVVGYTKGLVPVISVPPPKNATDDLFTLPSIIAFLFSLLSSLGFATWLWWKNGRDFWWKRRFLYDPEAKAEAQPIGAHDPVVVEYDPPEKLRPAEIGVLIDERADTLDVTATIIDLAARGYLNIVEVKKKWLFGKTDYSLEKKDKDRSGLLDYEKELLERIFEDNDIVTVSGLKTKFYEDLKKVKEKLYKNVVARKFFADDPDWVRTKYFLIAAAVAIFGGAFIFAGLMLVMSLPISFGSGFVLGGILLSILSRAMPRRTAAGHEMYRRARGYELFITRAERYRQQFFERKNIFNEILPYAIVFGATEKFAKAFKDLGIEPPKTTWYTGSGAFNAAVFGASMASFSNSFSSAISSAPGGGSGFSGGGSGGGFGGGGGGSW